METQYSTAEPGDYEELIDFGNYVFSHAHFPTDFPRMLPKLYKREYFMEGTHYLAKEGGRIRAAVGAYPLKLNILGTILPGRGIGMVSVHPYARSRGYMRALMEIALADMRRDGIVFSCLSGQRQRYEYFGFSPGGIQIAFECRGANLRHFLGPAYSPAFSIRQIEEGDPALDGMYRLHQSKAARFERDRAKLFDLLSSWKNQVFALQDGNRCAGYLVYDEGKTAIPEINLEDPRRMAEALACFFMHTGKNQVSVTAQPWETAKLEALAAFAEDHCISGAYSFAVFDWQPFLSALLPLKPFTDGPSTAGGAGPAGPGQSFPQGEAAFRVKWGNRPEMPESCFRIAVQHGEARIHPGIGPGTGEGAIILDPPSAARLFFSPLAPWASPILRGNPFLRGILPLPLFFESPDGI